MNAEVKEIPRPFKVTIRARVQKDLYIEKKPAFAEDLADAVDKALDEFHAENNWDASTVLEVSVTRTE